MPDTPNVTTALITGGCTVLGVLVTAAVALYTAKLKTTELEITYRQKQADVALKSARKYSDDLYVPLNKLLNALVRGHQEFKRNLTIGSKESVASDIFRACCKKYLGEFDSLYEAHGAYLLPLLESRALSFADFLRASFDASEAKSRMSFTFRVFGWTFEHRRVAKGSALSPGFRLGISPVPLFGYVGAAMEVEELLCAPLPSASFEERFIGSIEDLRALIKQVTLSPHVPVG